jgi:hypothetical protein
MILDWTIDRRAPNGQVVLGTLSPGSGAPCCTLERLAVLIPAGRYQVMLTVSPRVQIGRLWAPYDDARLPELLHVPDRTKIRLHAGNHIAETDGCPLVGAEHSATELHDSRPALTRLVNELRAAERDEDQVWLTVRSAI